VHVPPLRSEFPATCHQDLKQNTLPPGATHRLFRTPYRCDAHHAAACDCGSSPQHVECALALCGRKITNVRIKNGLMPELKKKEPYRTPICYCKEGEVVPVSTKGPVRAVTKSRSLYGTNPGDHGRCIRFHNRWSALDSHHIVPQRPVLTHRKLKYTLH
jgi:hypothetical protein